MADAMQGIMSLPTETDTPGGKQDLLTPENAAVFDQLRQNFTPEQLNQELLTAGEEVDPQAVMQFKSMLRGMQLPPEIIDALGKIVDMALAEPDKYPELRAELIKEGVPEDILPPEFDAAYFGAMNMALDEMSAAAGPTPQGFAMGGSVSRMNPIASGIASLGRNGDTMLAHITPSEARMLRRNGGSGTVNPRTGLPEFFIGKLVKSVGKVFKSAAKAVTGAVKGVVSAVKSFSKSTVGKMVTAVALGFVLGPAAAAYLGVSSAAGVAAIGGFIGGAGSTLLAGGNLNEALKSGAMSAVIGGAVGGVTQGFKTPYAGPTTVSGQLKSLGNAFSSAPAAAGTADEVAAATGAVDDVGASIPGPTGTYPNPDGTFTVTKFDRLGNPLPSVQGDPIGDIAVGNVGQAKVDAARNAMFNRAGAAPAPVSASASNVNDDVLAAIRNKAPSPVPSGPPSGSYSLTGGKLPGVGASDMVPSDYLNYSTGANAGGPSSTASIYDKVAGKVSDAYQGTKNIYNEYLSPSGIQSQGAADAVAKVQNMFPGVTSQQIATAPANSIIGEAYRNALPGTLATYGPLAATIGAGAYAAGAFDSQPAEKPEPPTLGSDVFAANPQDYLVPPGGVDTQYYGGVQGAQFGPQRMKTGGIADLPTKYPRKNGPINGPGTGTSDDIPAMLSDGEFVFTAKAVRNMGGGSRRLGAKRMYTMMKALEKRSA
jgi:hypothetical protein